MYIPMYVYREILSCSSNGKESACDAGDQGLFPGLGSFSGEGSGNTRQNSCLENSMGREAQRALVRGVASKELDTSERLTHTQRQRYTHTHTHTHKYFKGIHRINFSLDKISTNTFLYSFLCQGFPDASDGKESAHNAVESSLIPEKWNGYPLQDSFLENSMDRGAWWATAHGIAELDMTD